VQLPAALAKLGLLEGGVERYMGLLGLGLFGPTVAALLVVRSEPGGIRGFFGQLRKWRVGLGWWVLAIALPGLVMTAGLAVYRLATGNDPGPWTYFPTEAPRIVALFLIPFVEELGWRGYALPRLQARLGAVWAGLVLGVVWAVWHLPMFVVQGIGFEWLAFALVYFPAGSLCFSWLYNRTGGSLPIVIGAHFGAHLDSSMASMPGNAVPWVSQGVGYLVLALVLLAVDRKAWVALAPASRAEG
jgi:membrane protease YdiL (CAAX protease family)